MEASNKKIKHESLLENHGDLVKISKGADLLIQKFHTIFHIHLLHLNILSEQNHKSLDKYI